MTAAIDDDTAELLAQAAAAEGNGVATLELVWRAARAAGEISAELAMTPTARLWFTPWRIDSGEKVTAREREWLAGTQRQSIEWDGGSLAAFVAGDGPTVLLVHGWGDFAARLGAFVAPLVAQGFRVVGVDLPGHGDSGAGETDLYVMAAAVSQVLRSEDVRAVVAHSLGAVVALRALQEDARVDALLFVSPALRMEHSMRTFGRMYQLPPTALTGLRQWIDDRYGAGVWADFHADALAARVDVPALVLHADDDDQVDLDDGRTLASALPQGRFQEVSGLGHTRIVRDPAVLSAASDFLHKQVSGLPERSIT